MKNGLIRMVSAMLFGSIQMRGGYRSPITRSDYEQLTSDNCGSATNGGRKNSVAKAKREAQKARNRAAQRRYR